MISSVPRVFSAVIAAGWGIISTLTGITQKYGGLVACRLLLGLVEGPLLPCLVAYLTFFYFRKELAVRFGYLAIGGAIAGAIGGVLAYGIGHIDGYRSLGAWRWYILQARACDYNACSTIAYFIVAFILDALQNRALSILTFAVIAIAG